MARPPVGLVYGAANSALVWMDWQRRLAAAGWPSIAVGLRGHGASDPCGLARTRVDDYAADVATSLDHLKR